MMKKIILLSSLFRSSKNISKEVEQEEERRSSETPRAFQEQEDLPIRSIRSIHEENSKSSSHGYVHSAISPNFQHSISDFFMKRKKGGVTKKETLGEYLWEYEAQYKEFKDNLNFQGFCKIKEDRSTKGK